MMIRLDLPEPPALNVMLDMAKERVRVGRKVLPIVYSRKKSAYETIAASEARKQAKRPRPIWRRWRVTAVHFRLHSRRDLVELLAGLKWPIDALVKDGWVEDDGPDHLLSVATPTQEVDRKNRGVTITITESED